MLEARGSRWPFLGTIFVGVVPVLAALVLAASARREPPLRAVWVAGASPLGMAACAVEQASGGLGRQRAARLHEAAVGSLRTWLLVHGVLVVPALAGLRRHWRKRALVHPAGGV
jgi:hypothetical protein